MEDIKYIITTDIQEKQQLRNIDMLSKALDRLQKAQIEKNTEDSQVFVSIQCIPKIQDVTCIQVAYYYNKNAKFFQKLFNVDEFQIEVLMQYYEQEIPNTEIRTLSTKDFKMVEKIFYDFVEKQIIPDLLLWEHI